MPEKSKIIVDESNLDSRVKLIKTNRKIIHKKMIIFTDASLNFNYEGNNNNVNMFRCYAGDKIEVKFLVPVCNLEREAAIILAAEIVIFLASASARVFGSYIFTPALTKAYSRG